MRNVPITPCHNHLYFLVLLTFCMYLTIYVKKNFCMSFSIQKFKYKPVYGPDTKAYKPNYFQTAQLNLIVVSHTSKLNSVEG